MNSLIKFLLVLVLLPIAAWGLFWIVAFAAIFITAVAR